MDVGPCSSVAHCSQAASPETQGSHCHCGTCKDRGSPIMYFEEVKRNSTRRERAAEHWICCCKRVCACWIAGRERRTLEGKRLQEQTLKLLVLDFPIRVAPWLLVPLGGCLLIGHKRSGPMDPASDAWRCGSNGASAFSELQDKKAL